MAIFFFQLVDVDTFLCSKGSCYEVVVVGIAIDNLALRRQYAIAYCLDIFLYVVYVPTSCCLVVGMSRSTYAKVGNVVPIAAVVA